MQKKGQILVEKAHYEALVDISLKYDVLLQQVANLQRAVFGSKSERYLPDPQQLVLDILLPEQKQQTQEQNSNEQSNESGLPKNKAKAQPKRKPLPKELARIIKDIYPEGDLTGLKYLGYESSERLAITAPNLFVEETRRHKYVKADGQGVLIAPVPASVLPKSIAATSLICYILTSKFLDHLPFYRIISLLKRNGIELKDSTLNDWYSGVVDNYLIRLYERINEILVRCSYLQMDETFIRVMDKIMNKGSTHQWALRRFLSKTGALAISGYNKDIDFTKSTAFDLLYFQQCHKSKSIIKIDNEMKAYHNKLGKELGFVLKYWK